MHRRIDRPHSLINSPSFINGYRFNIFYSLSRFYWGVKAALPSPQLLKTRRSPAILRGNTNSQPNSLTDFSVRINYSDTAMDSPHSKGESAVSIKKRLTACQLESPPQIIVRVPSGSRHVQLQRGDRAIHHDPSRSPPDRPGLPGRFRRGTRCSRLHAHAWPARAHVHGED